MDNRQKFITAALVGLGVFVIAFSVYQTYANLYHPFQKDGVIISVAEMEKENKMAMLRYVLSLQKIDSDNDGLSDYDELYVYGTSPYLSDTDSDGIDDRTELESGGDPLCHKFQDCSGQTIELPELPTELEEQIPDYSEMTLGDAEGLFGSPASIYPDITPAEVRELLAEGGVDQTVLDGLSDEQLMDTWNQALAGSLEGL